MDLAAPPPPATAQYDYKVGDMVDVARRMWPGINQPGGIAQVKKVNYVTSSPELSIEMSLDPPPVLRLIESVDVFYPGENRRERGVIPEFLTPSAILETDVQLGATGRGTKGRCTRCGSLRRDCNECDWRFEQEESLRLIREKEEEECRARNALLNPSSTLPPSGEASHSRPIAVLRSKCLDASSLLRKKERRNLRKISKLQARLDIIAGTRAPGARQDSLQSLVVSLTKGAPKKAERSYADIKERWQQVAASENPDDFLSDSSSSSTSDSDASSGDDETWGTGRRLSKSRIGSDQSGISDADSDDTDEMVNRSREKTGLSHFLSDDDDSNDEDHFVDGYPPSQLHDVVDDDDDGTLSSLLSPSQPPNNDDSSFDARSPTFKQPEGNRAANAIPSDIIDVVSSKPFPSLQSFFNDRADEIDHELLPDVRFDLVGLQRAFKRLGLESVSEETLLRTKAIEEKTAALRMRCVKELINGGTDQLRAALKRLEKPSEIKKYKSTLPTGAFKNTSWRWMTELMSFRLDSLGEAIDDLMKKVKSLCGEIVRFLSNAGLRLGDGDGDGDDDDLDDQSDDSESESGESDEFEETATPSGALFDPSSAMDTDGQEEVAFDPYETATIRYEGTENQKRKQTKRRSVAQERKRKKLPMSIYVDDGTTRRNSSRREVSFSERRHSPLNAAAARLRAPDGDVEAHVNDDVEVLDSAAADTKDSHGFRRAQRHGGAPRFHGSGRSTASGDFGGFTDDFSPDRPYQERPDKMDVFLLANSETEGPSAPEENDPQRYARPRSSKTRHRGSSESLEQLRGKERHIWLTSFERQKLHSEKSGGDHNESSIMHEEGEFNASRVDEPSLVEPIVVGSIVDDVFYKLLRPDVSSELLASLPSVDDVLGWNSTSPTAREISEELRVAFSGDTKRASAILNYLVELVTLPPSDNVFPPTFTHPLLETFQSLLTSGCDFPSSISNSTTANRERRDLILLLLTTVSAFISSKCHGKPPENPFTSPRQFIEATICILIDMYYADHNSAYLESGHNGNGLGASSYFSASLRNQNAPTTRLLSMLAKICNLPEAFATVILNKYPNQTGRRDTSVISSLHPHIFVKGKELNGPSRLKDSFKNDIPRSEIGLIMGFLGICAYFSRVHGILTIEPTAKSAWSDEYNLMNRLLFAKTAVLSKDIQKALEASKEPKLPTDPAHISQLSKELRFIAQIIGSKTVNSPPNHLWLTDQVSQGALKLLANTNYPHTSENKSFRFILDDQLSECAADCRLIFEEAGSTLKFGAYDNSVMERLLSRKRTSAIRDVAPFHECTSSLLVLHLQYALAFAADRESEKKSRYRIAILKYVRGLFSSVAIAPQNRLLYIEHGSYTLLSAACAGVFESTDSEFVEVLSSLFSDVNSLSDGLLAPMSVLRSKIFCCFAEMWKESISALAIQELTRSVLVATNLLRDANEQESVRRDDAASCMKSANMLAICSAMMARAVKSISDNGTKTTAIKIFTAVAENLVAAAVVVSQSLDLGPSGDICIRCVLAALRASSGYCLKHVVAAVDVSAAFAAALPLGAESDEFDEFGSVDLLAVTKAEELMCLDKSSKENESIYAMSSLQPVLFRLQELISFSKPSSRTFRFASGSAKVRNELGLSPDGSSLISRNAGAFTTCVVDIIGLTNPNQNDVRWEGIMAKMIQSNNESHAIEDQSYTRPLAQHLSAEICKLALKNDTAHFLVKDGWRDILKHILDCTLEARIIERFPTMNFDLLEEEMSGIRRKAVECLHKVEEKAVRSHNEVVRARDSNKDAHATGIKVKRGDAFGEPGPLTMAKRIWTFSHNFGCLLKLNGLGCGVGDIFLSCSDLAANAPFKAPFRDLRLGSLENECGKRVALLTKVCAEVIEKKDHIREGVAVRVVLSVGYGLMRNVSELIAGGFFEKVSSGGATSSKRPLFMALKKAYCELAMSVLCSLTRMLAPDCRDFGNFAKNLRDCFFTKAVAANTLVARPTAALVIDAVKKSFEAHCALAVCDPHVVEAVKRRTRELLVHCGKGQFTAASSTLFLYKTLLGTDGGAAVAKLVGERISFKFSELSSRRDELQLAIDKYLWAGRSDSWALSDDETSLSGIRFTLLRECLRKIAPENEEFRVRRMTAQIMIDRHESLQCVRDILRFYRNEEDDVLSKTVQPRIDLSQVVLICSTLIRALQYGIIQLKHERELSQQVRATREASNIFPTPRSILYSLSLTVECLDRAMSLVVAYGVGHEMSILALSAIPSERVHEDADHKKCRICSQFARFVTDEFISGALASSSGGILLEFDWSLNVSVFEKNWKAEYTSFVKLWKELNDCKLNVVRIEENCDVVVAGPLNQVYLKSVDPGGIDGEERHAVLLRKSAKNLNAKFIAIDAYDSPYA